MSRYVVVNMLPHLAAGIKRQFSIAEPLHFQEDIDLGQGGKIAPLIIGLVCPLRNRRGTVLGDQAHRAAGNRSAQCSKKPPAIVLSHLPARYAVKVLWDP
jgi:hypothetical protein